MSSKSKLGWILLSGASIAALGAMGTASAQDDVSDEIVVTATGRAAALDDEQVAALLQQVPGARVHRDLAALAEFLMRGGASTPAASAAPAAA